MGRSENGRGNEQGAERGRPLTSTQWFTLLNCPPCIAMPAHLADHKLENTQSKYQAYRSASCTTRPPISSATIRQHEQNQAHRSASSSSELCCALSTRRRRRTIWLVVLSWLTFETMEATWGF